MKITGVAGRIVIPTAVIDMTDSTSLTVEGHIQRGSLAISSDTVEILPAQDDAAVNSTTTNPTGGSWVITRTAASRWRLTAEGVLDDSALLDPAIFGTHGRGGEDGSTILAELQPTGSAAGERRYRGKLSSAGLNINWDRNGECRWTYDGMGTGPLITLT